MKKFSICFWFCPSAFREKSSIISYATGGMENNVFSDNTLYIGISKLISVAVTYQRFSKKKILKYTQNNI